MSKINEFNKQCILCRDVATRTIQLFGRKGRRLKIAEKISKHFWFSVSDGNIHWELGTFAKI